MDIELRSRQMEEVRIYFEKTEDDEINEMLPRSVMSIEQAIENYNKSLLPDASSFGKTIYLDGKYIGDVWCYCIDKNDTPEAMLSYCIFEKTLWGQGIATESVAKFLNEIKQKYDLKSVGAFCFSKNAASLRVLEKNGFVLMETFIENGIQSCYLEKQM